MQPDLRKLQRQCLPRVLFNIFRPSHLMIKYKREVFFWKDFLFMLTKPCFMNKLIEDMERLGTKRVPDRFIQRERAPG